MRYIILAQILFFVSVTFASDIRPSCELAKEGILSRSSSGLAQVSNLGDIHITCRVPARPFPTKPGVSAEEADCGRIAGAARQLIREPLLAFARIIIGPSRMANVALKLNFPNSAAPKNFLVLHWRKKNRTRVHLPFSD